MAEPLTPEDAKLAVDHLNKWPMPTCSLCQSKTWQLVGIECSPSYEQTSGMRLYGEMRTMPVLAIACETCGYVMHVAWWAIKKRPPSPADPQEPPPNG